MNAKKSIPFKKLLSASLLFTPIMLISIIVLIHDIILINQWYYFLLNINLSIPVYSVFLFERS